MVPHNYEAGTIDMVRPVMSTKRLGQRAWCYGALSYRPLGTAAKYVVVPETLAVPSEDRQRTAIGVTSTSKLPASASPASPPTEHCSWTGRWTG